MQTAGGKADAWPGMQGFEHADGRLAAASTVKALVGKLPGKLLSQWAPLFYMPLVLGMTADPDAACRQMLSGTLEALIQVKALWARRPKSFSWSATCSCCT